MPAKASSCNSFHASSRTKQEFISTIVTSLKQCNKEVDLDKGKALHSHASETGCDTNKYVATALINMYSRCGDVETSHTVFNAMVGRDSVSWNSLILGYARNGKSLIALELFLRMDCQPDSVTFVAAVKTCFILACGRELHKVYCLEKGVEIHRKAKAFGFDRDVFVASNLVSLYTRCGSVSLARYVFDRAAARNVVLWTSMLLGYVENRESLRAIELFSVMDCKADSLTFVAVLKACSRLAEERWFRKDFCLHLGVGFHREARKLGVDTDSLVGNGLVEMYGKCGSMSLAWEVIHGMTNRDVVMWNTLALGYVENGEPVTGMDLLQCMEREPSYVTVIVALKACSQMASGGALHKLFCLEKGAEIHKKARSYGFEKHQVVMNTLVDTYCKCGGVRHAKAVFDNMRIRDVVSWNNLLHGYVENAEESLAIDLFRAMDCEPDSFTYATVFKAYVQLVEIVGKEFPFSKGLEVHLQAKDRTDLFAANTLLELYSKCGRMELARAVFDGLRRRDIVTWNSLMLGYEENGESWEALRLFTSIDCVPNAVTFVAGLKACGSLGAVAVGERLHMEIINLGFEREQMMLNSLVDFYGKCGFTRAAERVFNNMKCKDVVSWTSLLAGYSRVGDTAKVLSVVKEMQEAGVQPNEITALLVLRACNHAGLVDEAKKCFESMSGSYGFTPSVEHYNCMVDTFGRANRLEEALSLARDMPFREGNRVVWRTLLAACMSWSNLEVGNVAFGMLTGAGESRVERNFTVGGQSR